MFSSLALNSYRYNGEKLGRNRMNRRKTGTAYEEIAVNYLREQGIYIREMNYRISEGEIDVIGEDKECIIFIEVKYRKTASYGEPWEAVSIHKQKKICNVARQYCYSRRIRKQVRYDIVSICGEEILWFQNAFEHLGQW